jgi:hypothetical protein
LTSGYDGKVFIPEPEDGNWRGNYDDQLEWESTGLNIADVIVFWIPRYQRGKMAIISKI